MRLELYSKNFSWIASIELPDGPVPRTGDWITIPAEWQPMTQQLTTAMVHDVRWAVEDGKLTADVHCHACGDNASIRRVVLEEQGWLQPAP